MSRPTKPSEELAVIQDQFEDGEDNNFDILNMVMARLWKTAPFKEPILALEVRAGEYKGMVFSFSKFHMMKIQMKGGFIPTKYETTIHQLPPSYPVDWVADEAFDSFTSEILFKWLSYLHMNDLAPLLNARTGRVQ